MKTINIKNTAMILTVAFIALLSSCKKDKDIIADLTLDKSSVEVFVGETVEVKITGGNGTYTVSSSAENTATAEVSSQTVKISGKSKGEATITVKDGSGKTSAIKVTVKNTIVDASTTRFKWTNTIELDKVGGASTTVQTNGVAVTSLGDKKQYILSWTGGYSVGDKNEAKLRIAESGKTTEEIALSALEVQSVENDLYSIVFNKDTQKGELVFKK